MLLMSTVCIAITAGIGSLAPRMRQAAYAMQAANLIAPDTYDVSTIEYLFGQADKIGLISYIFPIFFVAVVCMVVFMTITRFVEVERSQIGCMKTLGYGKNKIILKYLALTTVYSSIGVSLGLIFGHFVFSPILYNTVVDYFATPKIPNNMSTYVIILTVATFLFINIAAILTVLKTAIERPAKLLQGKSPKIGKKILLERITPIWGMLKFKYKSTMRNIFRYKVRFFMMLFSLLFSTTLVFAGVSLALVMKQTNPEMDNVIGPVSIIVVVSAVLLNVLVIYNITNINIEERRREIATLKVLGYKPIEVTGYIFREIFLITLFGALVGLPVGYGFMALVFGLLGFGGIQYIDWYVWFIVFACVMSSLAMTFGLLNYKIRKVNMTTSLKSVD